MSNACNTNGNGAGGGNLLKKYKEQPSELSAEQKDQLIMEYAPLIKFIAQKIAIRLPSNIELDDLISSGVIGLMDAIEKYDRLAIISSRPMQSLESGALSLMSFGLRTGFRGLFVINQRCWIKLL